ncbi:MAG: hypothetical protein AUI36_03535 [Cyanobacteria bacterium 13_1_40CM_2_61_4]|nr:MAG: hypothetical protein AUI36_03535 [Cyanobacteria bacterium 13_1_40CM_2_61_4]
MSATVEKPTVVICDPEGPESVPSSGAFRIIDNPRLANAKHYHNVFILTTVTCLEPIADFVSAVNRRNQLRALFVRYEVDASWLPQMFEFAKLRTMRNTFAHSGFTLPNRVLRAWQLGAQNELIADARVVGDALYVMSCEPESYKIPFESVPALRDLPTDERSNFQIPDDGSYIHWPAQDVHMDLDSLLTAVDPERRAKAERIKRSYGRQYGAAISRLRKERGMKQTDIEGLSDREVRRIETDGDVTTDSLKKLAAAHTMDLAQYLDTLAKLSLEIRTAPVTLSERRHRGHARPRRVRSRKRK